MTIKMIKLITQEEILAEVTNETPTFVQLKNPMILMVVGEGQLGLVPWPPLADKDEIMINVSSISYSYLPKEELLNHYRQRTGSIVTAGPGVLNQLDRWRGESSNHILRKES